MENYMSHEEEYLDVNELCKWLKYKRQTVYNKIYRKEFIVGIHYFKPTKKKILFKRTKILNWLEEEQKVSFDSDECLSSKRNKRQTTGFKIQNKDNNKSLKNYINI